MRCMICNSHMSFFLSKKFDYMNLGKVRYDKCDSCGFVQARELIELPQKNWENIGLGFLDEFYFDSKECIDSNRESRLSRQSIFLRGLVEDGLVRNKNLWLDYACGDGELVKLLNSKGLATLGCDKYNNEYNYKIVGRSDLVVNTSYFEHARYFEELDIVDRYVKHDGALALNTLICSEIPRDPDWFYFLPVHCSFFTNRTAEILFGQWGYQSCIYSPDARMWIWFKKQLDPKNVPDYYLFKQNGFLGYW